MMPENWSITKDKNKIFVMAKDKKGLKQLVENLILVEGKGYMNDVVVIEVVRCAYVLEFTRAFLKKSKRKMYMIKSPNGKIRMLDSIENLPPVSPN